MKFLVLSYLVLLFIAPVIAQDVITDPKGNFIFGMPSTTIQPKISSNNIGVETPLWWGFWKKIYYVVDEETNDTINTVAKSTIIFLKGNVINNSSSSLIFDKKINYSPVFDLGIARGFDSIINPSAKFGFYYTYAASFFGEYQNYKYYDTIVKDFSLEKTNRLSPGVRGNITVFCSTLFALSTSASFQNSIVTENLTSYQKKTNTFYFDNNIATNGSNDGYISPLNPVNNFRLSLALPQFWLSCYKNEKFPFVVTPYYYGIFVDNNSANHNAGIVLSFLGEKFRKFDRDDKGKYNKNARYKFDQAFNIGYNIISTNSDSQHYFFLSGTFSLGKIAKESK